MTPFSMMKNYIVIISVFFDSILKSYEQKRYLYFFLHLIYVFVVVIPVSFFGSFFILMFRSHYDVSLIYLTISIAGFITISLASIVLLNFNIKNFCLPRYVLNSFIILKDINFKGIVITSLWFILGTYFLLLSVFFTIANFLFPDNTFLILLFSFILFIFTVLLYCEATPDKEKRSERQFILWLLLFVLLSILTFLSIPKTFQSLNEKSMINLMLLLMGLIFNFSLIMDKARDFFEKYYEKNKNKIFAFWDELEPNYNYKRFFETINSKFGETKGVYLEIKEVWKKGQKLRIIFFLFVFPILVYYIFALINKLFSIHQIKIEKFITNLVSSFFDILATTFFNGDRKLVIVFLILIILLYNFFKRLFLFIRSLKESYTLKGILSNLDNLLFISIYVFFLLGYIFELMASKIFMYSLLIIFLVSVFLHMVIKYFLHDKN
ncbi:hypothetical protein JOC75_001975 [Metabacillus crassostreae]|uniref:hypothetical protein n=1 Tax=Metabacillus crassostreae TaxID=929098 RepID=UPI001957959B|nr:hypothetical protein [Metabacillus crassostreae]MBM7604002.1 hypothetical protein [Metabacillus crassostreae]